MAEKNTSKGLFGLNWPHFRFAFLSFYLDRILKAYIPLLKNWDASLSWKADCIITARRETSIEAFKMQGRHVCPVASPHCLSVFLWASEPLRCNTCAQSLLWHFLLIHFSQIFTLYTSQVCFYPCRAFDLLPECSLAWPGRFRPGLSLFSPWNILYRLLSFSAPNDTMATSDSSADPSQ